MSFGTIYIDGVKLCDAFAEIPAVTDIGEGDTTQGDNTPRLTRTYSFSATLKSPSRLRRKLFYRLVNGWCGKGFPRWVNLHKARRMFRG